MTASVWLEMMPARVREREGADHVDVAFLESARLYKLFRSHQRFAEAVARLQDAVSTRKGVRILLASLDSDVIEEIQSDP